MFHCCFVYGCGFVPRVCPHCNVLAWFVYRFGCVSAIPIVLCVYIVKLFQTLHVAIDTVHVLCVFHDKSMKLCTVPKHYMKKIFGYRDITNMSCEKVTTVFSKWPSNSYCQCNNAQYAGLGLIMIVIVIDYIFVQS